MRVSFTKVVVRLRAQNVPSLIFSFLSTFPLLAFGFTQSGIGIDAVGNTVPVGHEWVTRLSMFEVIGGDPVIKPDPKDPRANWRQGRAKNLALGEAGKKEYLQSRSPR